MLVLILLLIKQICSLQAENIWNYCLHPVTNDDRHPPEIDCNHISQTLTLGNNLIITKLLSDNLVFGSHIIFMAIC